MSIMLKSIEQSFETTHRPRNTTGQHPTKMLQDDSQKNSKEFLEKAEVKSDGKNFTATAHLATEPIL